MIHKKWHTAYASAIGTSHAKTGAHCQDNGVCCTVFGRNDTEILIAIASDGAGSACKSEIGSSLVVDSFIKRFRVLVAEIDDVAMIDRAFVLDWMYHIQQEIKVIADEENLQLKDFACTAVCAIVGRKNAVFFQIGDGAIVVSEKLSAEYSPVFWPQHGEFANQTNFITQDNIAETLEFAILSCEFDEVALFTDGLERLILNFSTKTVHVPSLESIFTWLRTAESNINESPSKEFSSYLNSDLINKRTDDDKTLIMATRRSHDR